MEKYSIQLLGTPRIKLAQKTLLLRRQRSLALLTYLAIHENPVSRLELSAMLWPDAPVSDALTSLRALLVDLRKTLKPELIETTHQTIALNKNGYRCDVTIFRELLASYLSHCPQSSTTVCSLCLKKLVEAIDLIQGEFLAGFYLRNSNLFEDWQMQQAEQLKREIHLVLEKIIHGYSDLREYSLAIQYVHRWLTSDPFQECGHRKLMELYVLSGDCESALRHYENYKNTLALEWNLQPQMETTSLFKNILHRKPAFPVLPLKNSAVNAPSMVVIGELPLIPDTQPMRFPVPLTSFYGRTQEYAYILDMLQTPDCRLLTLIGMGGTGKTRLALEIVNRLAQNNNYIKGLFSSGIYFIPLETLQNSDRLLQKIATYLELPLNDHESPQKQFIRAYENKKFLLILDNFEHLIDSSKLITELLSSVPGFKFLITSRERLALQEEWTLEIRGLDYPFEEITSKEPQPLQTYSAIQLFLQCARHSNPMFKLDSDNGRWIAKICQLMQGLPLGIELAAEETRYTSCRAIAENLECSLIDLYSSYRNLPTRQASLRAVFADSWQLLTLHEQMAFSRLSVFRDSFSFHTAKTVGVKDEMLLRLVDKSLVYKQGDSRYNLHPVFQQIAREKLSESLAMLGDVEHQFVTCFSDYSTQVQSILHDWRPFEILEISVPEMRSV